jgi:putative PEP-CTERM system histidine kinase
MSLVAGGFGSLAFLAYAVVAILVVAGRIAPPRGLVLLGLAASLAAAAAGLAVALLGPVAARPAALAEVLLWVLVLAVAGRHLRDPFAGIALGLALVLSVSTVLVAPADPWLMAMAAAAIVGLFLAAAHLGDQPGELSPGQRWLVLALAFGCVFDLALAGLALAGAVLLPAVESARPALRLALAPLLAVGLAGLALPGDGRVEAPAARRFGLVAAVTAAALLLVGLAAGRLGAATGAVFGLALGLPAALAILAAALHPAAGRRLEDWTGRLWPRHRYDYREVWPDFVDVLTGADPRPGDDLPERVVRAVAGTVGAKSGAIWLAEGDDRYRRLVVHGLPPVPCASGSIPGLAAALMASDAALAAAGRTRQQDVRTARLLAYAWPATLAWPSFLPPREEVWLILPLVHKQALFGFLVLGNPCTPRPLDHEDRELLRLVARHATSYLAEDEATRQLSNARQYEHFTRRFAYVMHDVKNVTAELSLTLANAKRHRNNPAFIDDMLETLDFSVARMNRLIDQLRQERQPRLGRVALAPLVRRIKARRPDPRLTLGEPLPPLAARVEAEALATALEHLVDNALEALGPNGRVRLGLEQRDGMAALVVADDGPGLPAEIIAATGRAKAFASARPGGLGLGLDQARNTVERVGGRFDLASERGKGTTITLCLPALELVEQPA